MRLGLMVIMYLIGIGILIWGWALNIIALINMDFMAHIGLGIVRVVGIFMAPLGTILGFFA